MSNTEMKVVFAPGCFDSFEGTQEELEAFMAEITEALLSGNFQEDHVINDNFVATRHVYEDSEDESDITASMEQMTKARKRMLN